MNHGDSVDLRIALKNWAKVRDYLRWHRNEWEAGRQPHPMPQELFEGVAEFTAQASPELAIVDGLGRICLAQRPTTDVYWPGQWHLFGTTGYGSDRSKDDLLARLQKEVDPDGSILRLEWERMEILGWLWSHSDQRERGSCMHVVHLYRFSGALVPPRLPGGGIFFRIDALPEYIIEHHRPMLEMVRRHLAK